MVLFGILHNTFNNFTMDSARLLCIYQSLNSK